MATDDVGHVSDFTAPPAGESLHWCCHRLQEWIVDTDGKQLRYWAKLEDPDRVVGVATRLSFEEQQRRAAAFEDQLAEAERRARKYALDRAERVLREHEALGLSIHRAMAIRAAVPHVFHTLNLPEVLTSLGGAIYKAKEAARDAASATERSDASGQGAAGSRPQLSPDELAILVAFLPGNPDAARLGLTTGDLSERRRGPMRTIQRHVARLTQVNLLEPVGLRRYSLTDQGGAIARPQARVRGVKLSPLA